MPSDAFVANMALAQDTMWIDDPRVIDERTVNEGIMLQAQKDLAKIEEAADRLREAPLIKIPDGYCGTRLNEIYEGMPASNIVISREIRHKYFVQLKKWYEEASEEYQNADTAVQMSKFLDRFRPFYIRDNSMVHFWEEATTAQIDSLREIYNREYNSSESCKCYFSDWLWLHYHNMLQKASEKKDEANYYYEPEG